MTRASFELVKRTLTIDRKALTNEQAKRLLITTARFDSSAEQNRIQARTGVRPELTLYANTPGNSNLESVVLPGPIVANFEVFGPVIERGLELLQQFSPVDSGLWRSMHQALLNGTQIMETPKEFSERDEIILTNPEAYSRRIEIGVTESGRRFTMRVENRIYERVAMQLQKEFGRRITIRFGYTAIRGAKTLKGGLSKTYVNAAGATRKRRQQKGAEIRQPAIFITSKRR